MRYARPIGAFRGVGLAASMGLLLAMLQLIPLRAEVAPGDLIAKGEYLARAGDCIACHTKPGGKPFAGGAPLTTPFGDISVPNITPDDATGIGMWSDDDFYRALHEGIGKNGEYLYPAFPFPWYTKVTREDVLAIKAYLFSLPAEKAPRAPNTLTFPFNVRESLLAWRTLFFKPGEFQPDPGKSAEVVRGDYLVNGLGHCGECHNRRNILGASNWSGRLEGGEIEGWYAPNLTSSGHEGLGSWSIDQIATFLKTGQAPGKGVVLGPMAETIGSSLSHLVDSDLTAIALYLKSVPAEAAYKPQVYGDFKGARPAGGNAYLSYCASCHQPGGGGIPGAIPALAGNGAIMAKGPENVIRVVLGGLAAGHGLAPMPAIGVTMSDQEIADVTNYVRQVWGNDAPPTAATGQVAELRATTKTLLAGNLASGCPTLTNDALAQAVAGLDVANEFRGMENAPSLTKIDGIVAHLRSAIPAATNDDIVNTLTAAYCPLALGRTDLAEGERVVGLGTFSSLVYGQLKHFESVN